MAGNRRRRVSRRPGGEEQAAHGDASGPSERPPRADLGQHRLFALALLATLTLPSRAENLIGEQLQSLDPLERPRRASWRPGNASTRRASASRHLVCALWQHSVILSNRHNFTITIRSASL